jgi:outer membrane protein assembly factor BamB
MGVRSTLTLAIATVVLGMSQWAGDAQAASVVTTQWLGYHGGASGSGVAVGIHSVNTAAPKWTSPVLDGQLYGEPLVDGKEILVATENDTVYALSSATGAVRWAKHLATAVPSNQLPCGDISPTVGITGTPVIDQGRNEIFVMAFEIDHGVARHYLYGLSVTTGAVMMRHVVSTPTADQLPYLNRSALALDQGSVVYTFGGNYGDCQTYHGVVGAIKENGKGAAVSFVVDHGPGQSQGAIWMGGAAATIDAAGNVWVETGNGSVTSPGHSYDDSDGVLELSPTMHLKSFFAPTSWVQDNASDADLSAQPAVLGNGLVVATGKSGNIYLLHASHLGGVGGQIATINSGCGNVLDGGYAVHGNLVYLPCVSGPLAVRVTTSPVTITVVWRGAAGGGPPIMAAQKVWSIGQDGVLYGFNPTNGVVVQHVELGNLANHFSTPSVGDGLMLAPIERQVVAFSAH